MGQERVGEFQGSGVIQININDPSAGLAQENADVRRRPKARR
jgi:hypothetical protein